MILPDLFDESRRSIVIVRRSRILDQLMQQRACVKVTKLNQTGQRREVHENLYDILDTRTEMPI